MTKTIAQLRAEAVKRLTKLNEHGYWEFPVHVALCGRDVPDVDEERAIIADLLTDDCGPCYSCAKLAELMAENNAMRGIVGDMREDVAERDDVIAVLKAERAELEAKVDELTAQLEAAYAKNRSLRTHVSKMQEGLHGWHVKGVELQREVDKLARENISLTRDLGECIAERDALVAEIDALEYQGELDEPHGTLVDMDGEVLE